MQRNPNLQNFLDNFQTKTFGITTEQAQAKGVCPVCGKPITGFKDEISQKEYAITGYCQDCQDEVFDHFAECKGNKCEHYEKVGEKSGCKKNLDPDDCEILNSYESIKIIHTEN